MGFVEVSKLGFTLPGGRVLFEDLSFRVSSSRHVALVGSNGVGKTTILKLVAGRERPTDGVVRVEGRIHFMPQFIGTFGSRATVRDLLVSLAPSDVKVAHA